MNTGSFIKGQTPWNKGLMGWNTGHEVTPETRAKISAIHKGKPKTKEHRLALSLAKKGKKLVENPTKDIPHYVKVHAWIKRNGTSTNYCAHCGFKSNNPRMVQWANISGEYLFETTDWIRLCASCHKKYDRRISMLTWSDLMPKSEQQLKVINKWTGEIYEFKLRTIEDAEQAYLMITGLEGAVKRAKIKVGAYLDNALGDEDKYDFGDGYIAQRISGVRRKYQKPIVAQYLDEDQMDLVTEISGPKLKELIKQLSEEGKLPDGAWRDIEARAEITANKPYIKIIKG